MAKSKIGFSWDANKETNIPILVTFLGLMISVLLLTCGTKDPSHHDFVLLNKKELIDTALNTRLNRLRPLYKALLPYNRTSTAKDSVAKRDSFLKVQSAMVKAHTELYGLKNANADTSLKFFGPYFSADRHCMSSKESGPEVREGFGCLS